MLGMAGQPPLPPGSGKNSAVTTPTSLQNFQFTFSISRTDSGHSSFIEPDPNPDNVDSSESLSDSVQNFPEEFGRTYHAYRAGSYFLPNDNMERERLVFQGQALHSLFGDRLFFAPLSKANPPRHILDIATGMGDWAIQMGDVFSSSQVVATDLSPIQPEDVPPNVSFYVEDSSEPWDYSHSFDYIHTRITSGCWSDFKTQIAAQAFDTLSPGGWFESQEFDCVMASDDGTLLPDGALAHWCRDMVGAAKLLDRSLAMSHTLKQAYEEVGFVDVHERVFKMPLNAWPKDERLKELGRMWERNMLSGLSGFSVWLFNRAFGRTPAETEVMLMDVRREMSDPRIHSYMPVYVVWGRKPFPGETVSRTRVFES
ncbi:putative methyltransferase tdiE [Paramyrothecium foliicola]|nr:putative methyltransferase tdiE [Paramyrothecium foliicola]